MKATRALPTRIGFVSATNFSRQTNSSSMSADARPFLRCRGIDQVSYLNNSTMMDVDFLPEHLIVIGGSYVVWSLLRCTAALAVRSPIVEMAPRLIKREDEDVSENIKTILEGEGIKIRLSAECIAFEKRGDKVAVKVDCSSGDKTVVGSHVLLAIGRVPNTNDLGLENAGIEVDQARLHPG